MTGGTSHSLSADRIGVLYKFMRTHRSWLYGAIGAVVLLMLLVPYTLLTGVNAWYGSFLLWTVCTLIVLALSAVLSFGWED